eukprot:766051-Hanusia_phi.AAC.1
MRVIPDLGFGRRAGRVVTDRAAFAELGLSIAVSLLSLLRQFESFRTSPIVPELPAPDLTIK